MNDKVRMVLCVIAMVFLAVLLATENVVWSIPALLFAVPAAFDDVWSQ